MSFMHVVDTVKCCCWWAASVVMLPSLPAALQFTLRCCSPWNTNEAMQKVLSTLFGPKRSKE